MAVAPRRVGLQPGGCRRLPSSRVPPALKPNGYRKGAVGHEGNRRGTDEHHQERRAAASFAELVWRKLREGELEGAETESGRAWVEGWLGELDAVAAGRLK